MISDRLLPRASECIRTSVLCFGLVLGAVSVSGCATKDLNIPRKESVSPAVLEQWHKQGDWLSRQQDGDYLLYVQRFDKAEEAFQDAVEKARAFGPGDARLARSITGLARAYLAKRKWQEACEQYQQALAIKRKSYGDTHADVGDILTELAYAKANLGENAEARKLIDQTGAIWKKLGAIEGAEFQFVQAVVDQAEGKDTEAENKYKSATGLFLQQIDLHRYPQPIKSMRIARDCAERYAIWLDVHGKQQAAKDYRAKMQPINEWLMLMGESGV